MHVPWPDLRKQKTQKNYYHGWRIVETRGGAFPLVVVQFKAKWWITAILHRYKPNMNVKTTRTLTDIGLKRCFIKFSFILRGCFWQWEGALPRSGGAPAPSKLLILRLWLLPLSAHCNVFLQKPGRITDGIGSSILNTITMQHILLYLCSYKDWVRYRCGHQCHAEQRVRCHEPRHWTRTAKCEHGSPMIPVSSVLDWTLV